MPELSGGSLGSNGDVSDMKFPVFYVNANAMVDLDQALA